MQCCSVNLLMSPSIIDHIPHFGRGGILPETRCTSDQIVQVSIMLGDVIKLTEQHCIGVRFVVKAVSAAAICDGRVWRGVVRCVCVCVREGTASVLLS